MHVLVHKPNTGINPHEEAPKWIWKFATVVCKGPVIKASLREEAEGAHAESSCSPAIPGTVCMLKLAENTELNYHRRQVAAAAAAQSEPNKGKNYGSGMEGKKEICCILGIKTEFE